MGHKTDTSIPNHLTWREKINFGLVCTAFFLFMVLAHAGAMGIPVLVTIVGVVGYLTTRSFSVRRIPAWFWAFAVLVAWVLLSSLWSPYNDEQMLSNPVKLLIGFLLYPGALLSFRSVGQRDSSLVCHMLTAVLILALGVLLIDLMTGYGISFLVEPLKPGQEFIRRAAIYEMNLGHAIVVLALLMPLGMVLIYQQLPLGWLIAPVFAAFVMVAAMFGQLAVGLIAVIAGLAAMAFARFAPNKAIRVLTWAAIASILLAPFWAYPLEYVSAEFKASIPFSWEHRIEMWSYTSRKIIESPIWGHGFDAARAFDGTFSSRGVESWAIVSLHPHNAGLHIWAETGLIGAALASITLLTMGISVERFCVHSRPRAIAISGFFAVTIVIGNITYGVWQEWWWATLFFISGAFYLLPENSDR